MSALTMRGSKSRHVLILIDGVRINDPSSPDGSLNITNILTDNIERIEVLRGSYSTLYGSYATGGVVNVITKKGRGDRTGSVVLEGGAYGTFRESLSLSEGGEKSFYSVSVSRTDSNGISSAAKAPGAVNETERDGYGNLTLSTRIGYHVFDNAWISLVTRYYDATSDLDDEAYDDDPNYTMNTRQLVSVLSFDQNICSFWRHRLSVNYMNISRHSNDRPDTIDPNFNDSWYNGLHRKAEWQHNFSLGSIEEITIGGEFEQDSMESIEHSDYGFGPSTSAFDEKNIITKSLYAQNRLRLIDWVFLTAGIRYTDHETFSSNLDYQLSGSILLPITETRIRGNYSTGFHAPTISQLYTPSSGNKDLKPEESKSWDLGLEQALWSNKILFDVAYFQVDYDNMFGFEAGKNVNKGEFITSGVEFDLRFTPFDSLQIDVHYTYIHEADDKQTRERDIRNPKHQGGANINWSFLDRGNLNFGINHIGNRKDSWWDSSWTEHKVDAEYYTVIQLAGSFEIIRGFTAFGRIENLANIKYENPVGYKSPERSYYAGLKIVF